MATEAQAIAQSLVASVWFDRRKYEEAETKKEEITAERHSGLKIEGKPIVPSSKSDIRAVFDEAKMKIEETLRSVTSAPSKSMTASNTQRELEKRVTKLEKENEALTKRVVAIEKELLLLKGSKPTQETKQEEEEDDEDDDDFDLFGSDKEEEKGISEEVKKERIAAYMAKKEKKKPVVAKSSIILEVKPWDDETDMKELERSVRSVVADGLEWKASKLVPVAFGISKLQINCVVEDDKIGTDFLEEELTKFEDYVQSVDIAAFNKL